MGPRLREPKPRRNVSPVIHEHGNRRFRWHSCLAPGDQDQCFVSDGDRGAVIRRNDESSGRADELREHRSEDSSQVSHDLLFCIVETS